MCSERACGGFLPRGWQSFFERLNRIDTLLVGPRADMRKAQFLQRPVHRTVGDREVELLVQAHDQITGPPAYHAVDGGDRSLIYDACQIRWNGAIAPSLCFS